MKVCAFSAGPAKINEEAQRKLCQWIEQSPSIIEMSHRSDEFQTILQKTKQALRELLDVPSDMEILFLSGGASFQFVQCAQNLLRRKAGYLITGLFSKLAYDAACQYGECDILYDASDHPYDLSSFPDKIQGDYDYVYVCVNNSLYGTRTPDFKCNCPVVADVSSCLGVEKLDLKRYAVAFASAQKNFGLSGMSIVFLRKDLRFCTPLPAWISYEKLIEADSLLNTPPVLAILACGLCAEEMLKQKETLFDENRKKAELMYRFLDHHDFYEPLVKKNRSLMNITFSLKDENSESQFLKDCTERGFIGLKGHNKTGHLRTSLNAHVSLEEVKELVEWMKYYVFDKKGG